jgi:hypothetical protein
LRSAAAALAPTSSPSKEKVSIADFDAAMTQTPHTRCPRLSLAEQR